MVKPKNYLAVLKIMAEVYKIGMCSQSRYSCNKSFYYQFAVYGQYFK